MKIRSILLTSALGILILGLVSCGKNDELKVGVILPQEGSLEDYGFQILSGLEMAEEEINAMFQAGKNMTNDEFKAKYNRDKVLKKVTLIKEFKESSNYEDVQVAVDSFKKLIDKEVVAVIGPASSAGVLAITPLANKSRTAVISPSATSPEINREGGDYIFRIYPSDTLEAQQLGYVIFQKCFAHHLLVVRSLDSYGEGVSLEVLRFSRRLSDRIPNYVVKFEADPKTANYVEVADKIIAENPRAVFLGAYADSLIPLIKEIKSRPELQNLYIFCSSSFLPNQMLQALSPDLLQKVMFSQYDWDPKGEDIKVTEFAKKFEAKFGGIQPNIFAACGYDSLMVLSEALNDVNTDLPDLVKTALNKIHYPKEKGLLGETDFDKRGDVTRIPKVYKITPEGTVTELTEDDCAAIKREILTDVSDVKVGN